MLLTRSNVEDIAKVVSVVLNKELLTIVPGRKHSSFRRMRLNPLHCWKMEDTKEWIEKKKQFSLVCSKVLEEEKEMNQTRKLQTMRMVTMRTKILMTINSML